MHYFPGMTFRQSLTLTGMLGAGKSTIGSLVAEALGVLWGGGLDGKQAEVYRLLACASG
jgi:hypothetical protein